MIIFNEFLLRIILALMAVYNHSHEPALPEIKAGESP